MSSLGDPTALRAKIRTDAPNRRVEREELVEWLEEVDQVEFMDDLHAPAQVDKLWGDSRYRNAHLIAEVTAARLELCGWSEDEALAILKYMQPAAVAPVAATNNSVITTVIQADPDADRRSKEQADALSQALTLAVAGKHTIKRYINGESRRPIVTKACAYVHEVSGTAGKLHSDLADALSALHSDPHVWLSRVKYRVRVAFS